MTAAMPHIDYGGEFKTHANLTNHLLRFLYRSLKYDPKFKLQMELPLPT